MFPIPDALAAFYLTCFVVGFLFVFVSLFLGLTHDTLHLPGLSNGDGDHWHLGGSGQDAGVDLGAHGGDVGAVVAADGGPDGGDAASHPAHHGGHGVSPFNLSTAMAFLTWFGGAGYLLRVYAGLLGLASVVGAFLAGLAGGAIIFYFLARVLIPGQRILDPADYRMEGTVAEVTIPIGPDSVGEIVYSKGGSRRSDGARSVDGSAIERGTEVVIVRYERGIAYVEPWSSYLRKG
jgi:membrane protein implicated in regulation of membrane protease activity